MSSKRHIRRVQCEGKRRYDTHDAAQYAALVYLNRNGSNCRLDVYRCAFCEHFHFGHAKMGKTDRHTYKERRRDWIAA